MSTSHVCNSRHCRPIELCDFDRYFQKLSTSDSSSQAAIASKSNGKSQQGPAQQKKPDVKDEEDQKDAEKSDDEDSDDGNMKRPAFFDGKYATSTALGSGGTGVKIRVNRFNINDDLSLKSLYVYKIRLPKYNNRPVKNSNVKTIMIEKILKDQQPWSASYIADKIFTDWECLIFTKEKLEQLSSGPVNTTADGTILADFDFRNQASSATAPAEQMQAEIRLLNELNLSEFRAYLNGNKQADYDFSQHVRAFNIMARHFAANKSSIFRAGRNRIFSATTRDVEVLPSKLIARGGFFNSVRPANSGYQLHLNTTAATFYPADTLVRFLEGHFGDDFNKQSSQLPHQIKQAIRNLQVRYMYTPPDATNQSTRSRLINNPVAEGCRLKRVNGFGKSASNEKFHLNGKETSVQDHFNNHVMRPAHPVQHPNLPVVNVGATNEAGSKVYVPMEFLKIEPGQSLRTTVPQGDMDKMAKVSRKVPSKNVSDIQGEGMHLLRRADLHTKQILDVAPHMMEIHGRILAPPTIRYRQPVKSPDLQKMGQGKWGLQNKTFNVAGDLGHLFVIQVGHGAPMTKQSATDLVTALKQYGIKCSGEMYFQRVQSASIDKLNTACSSMDVPEGKPVLVVLPKKSLDEYALVKLWGDNIRGVHTICLTWDNADFESDDGGFRANLALKFNAKLGGQNHVLANTSALHGSKGSTMVVGADVTHPGSSSVQYCPSIAAVVASTNRDCVKFPGSMRLQRGKTEQILELKTMMQERLSEWQKHNRDLPDRIVYFRDGVGENQYAMVQQHELNEIRAACRLAKAGYNPPITVVVCTKRHMTRFYPSDETPRKFLDKREENFNPGLVVDDQSIRLPKLFDFWLQAQKPLQGTGRPCHYFVLENEIGYIPTQVQEITYSLSWVYATSLTTISVTAPAYYADKLCERGRCYIRQLLVSRYPGRPQALNDLANILPSDWDLDNATDEQTRDKVAKILSNGSYDMWKHKDNANPCHDAVTNTMFYI